MPKTKKSTSIKVNKAKIHSPASSGYGRFSPDNPQTEWLIDTDDRAMRLLKDFWYLDPQGKQWNSPANLSIDGASIPSFLWSVIGSPYTGKYRRASIIHDYACVKAEELKPISMDKFKKARKAADDMFYFACLCGGCSQNEAGILYAGVRAGAFVSGLSVPTSSQNTTLRFDTAHPLLTKEQTEDAEKKFNSIKRKIKNKSLTFEELSALIEKELLKEE